jgi:hypothetical protein
LKLRGFLFVTIHIGMWSYGQYEANEKSFPDLSIYGFMDVFNVYDFSKPQTINRQDFLFNHNRHNEFNLNLALIKFDLQHSKYRASFGLQTGTYVNDNMSAEPLGLKHIFEANIGVSLNKKNSLWLDAGVLPSHIGFESAISMDNFTLTRSLLAENSPYFLTGASLSFYPNDELELKALVVNGWQRIQRLEGNSLPSFGTQVQFSPTKQLTINWSTFIGTDENDENRRMRYFSNLYGLFQILKRIEFVVALDFGFQQHSNGSSDHDFWFSPIAIGQFNINEKWKSALRIEYYEDKESVITPALSQSGIQLTGASINFDYMPNENIICRVEGRWMNNKGGFIGSMGNSFNDNYIIATSVAIKLSRTGLNNVDNQNW